MIQIGLLVASVALIILGAKGFTAGGIPFTRSATLIGTRAKVVGALCILGGLALIPAAVLMVWVMSE
jgi:hypothetical protein